MTPKNFSPGDVVVCVKAGEVGHNPRSGLSAPNPLRRGRLYTVLEPVWSSCVAGVRLVDVAPPLGVGFYSDRFRLAYRPDPEVERERAEDPIKRPVSA